MSEKPQSIPPAPTADDIARRHTSAWSTSDKIKRMLWGLVQATLFRWSPHNAYGWRGLLLRRFGATIGKNVRLRPTVRVEIPWNLKIDDGSIVGDFAILYCLGPITVGKNVIISQYAHLCAGTHETHTHAMELLCPPIAIGDEVWIAADAFIGPGVTIGARTIVGARSSVFRNLPGDVVAVGNPARAIKSRTMTI